MENAISIKGDGVELHACLTSLLVHPHRVSAFEQSDVLLP
jgi:hypothetical protein